MAATANSNVGFYGTVGSAQTPLLFGRGVRYAVEGKDDLKVSAGGAGSRSVTVAAGVAWGDGVRSTWTSSAVLNAAENTTSSTRWDTLVIRRHWQPASSPTGTATLMLLTGGTSQTVAASRKTDAGNTDADQPIALVGVAPGAPSISAGNIIDLRIWAGEGGTPVAAHVKARDYVSSVGTTLLIDEVLHSRVLDSTGTPQWVTADLHSTAAFLRSSGDRYARIAPKGSYGLGPQWSVDGGATGTDPMVYAQALEGGQVVTKVGFRANGTMFAGSVPASLVADTPVGVRRGGTQTVPNNSERAYLFDGGAWSYDGGVSGASSGALEAPATGWYTVTAQMRWAVQGSGARILTLYLGGTVSGGAVSGGTLIGEQVQSADGAGTSSQNLSSLVKLSAGDQVRMCVRQTSGASLASAPTGSLPRLSIAWVGAAS